ncbi:MAG: AMP-dependent synthetase/ligase [Fimbriimonadaceae bacterium]|nr:MAG: Long-chain acyl-CoA synthetase (AMP-forming) [Armatimonadetes bacterium OLB18]WKZ79278.1 MAG: AMP-dependent synthetase/ligase [Fimbriimonadaceae bacterium]
MASEDRNETMARMFVASCAAYASKPAMLWAKNGEFVPLTYAELHERVRRFAAVLRERGLRKGSTIALQSENCPEWAWLDWACQCLGVVLVPIYPTLPSDVSKYIVQDSGASWVVVSGKEQQAKHADGSVPVVLLNSVEGSISHQAEQAEPMPTEEFQAAVDQVEPLDTCTIIYTSGTTGPPKGAVLPHQAPASVLTQIPRHLPIDHNDVFLSFLPMSHVFERIAGQFLPISCGATVGYAGSLMSLAGDIQKVRPTIMLCVPRFLEATMDRIVDATKRYPRVRKLLFDLALAQGVRKARGQIAPLAGVLDRLVGKKVRERFGGRLRFFVSGGAALAPHVAEFYMALGLKVLQGYGLTETTAASTVNHPERSKYWTVGEPIPGVEIRTAEDGEILIRGKSVMTGYHNLAEATREAIDSEGWFHTGDIGEWEGAHLKITDRKKDILVLANGKNVAPQPIENRLKESEWIAEAVLFGDGAEYVFGLIVPNFERLRAHLETLGIRPPTDEDLVASEKVRELIKAAVQHVNSESADFEKVKKHALVAARFTVESGDLTPTLKVRRKVVREKYADLLSTLRKP